MCIGFTFPSSFSVRVSKHACQRLVERFPEFAFKKNEAKRVILQCLRTGRVLKSRDVLRHFGRSKFGGCVTQLFSPDLGGLFRLKFVGPVAVVLTVIPAEPRPESAWLFGLEAV